jgi:flagellar hook-length control protein FliK
MKPSPVISIANTAPANTAKPANGTSSDQSFGQVLAQQTGAPPSSSSAAANGGSQHAAQSNAGSNGTPASNSNSSSSTQGSTSTSNGKNIRSKHGQDDSDSNTSSTTQAPVDPSANGSAQLLALVSSVQQATAPNAGTNSTSDSTDAIGTIASAVTSGAQAALANFQAAVSTGASVAQTAVQTATDLSQDVKAALPDETTQDTQNTTVDSTIEDQMTAATGNTQASTPQVADGTSTPKVVADLAASAQKDIQADIANLAQAASKSADAIRDTVASAAAAPAMVNTTQLNTAASQMSGADDKLTPQVGSPDWNQALGQKVVWMVAGGQQSASLTLNPPDLGPMQVVLNVTNSHATATFTAAQPEVRQALETAMPKLREMLGDAGIQLGQASVNAGTAQQQQNFANQASRSGRGGSDSGVDAIEGSRAGSSQAAISVTSGLGLVDTFA